MMNQSKGINMLTNDQIKEIALQNGFKLKEQPGGEMDLNPDVYHFAKTLESGVQAITAQKYTEALKQIGGSPNSKVVMMPLEAGNLIGSVAGIAELLKGDKKA